MAETGYYQFLMVLWPLAVTIKCFEFFLFFDGYRTLYVLIRESIKDSVEFIVILVFICLVFGMVKQLIELGSSTGESMAIIEQLLRVFLSALGDFTTPTKSDQPITLKRINSWIVLLLLQLVTNIVALNTLIAIIADSYERV